MAVGTLLCGCPPRPRPGRPTATAIVCHCLCFGVRAYACDSRVIARLDPGQILEGVDALCDRILVHAATRSESDGKGVGCADVDNAVEERERERERFCIV